MTECLSEELIDRLLTDTLSDAEEERVDAHLRECTTCRNLLSEKTNAPDHVVEALAPADNTQDDRREIDRLFDLVRDLPTPNVGDPDDETLASDDRDSAVRFATNTRKKGQESDSEPAGFEMIEEIGRGGVGVVFKARQTRLGRIVALKMMLPRTFPRPKNLARFRGEAEVVAKLQHPNVVQVFDILEHDGCPYLCMEFVPGGNLAEKLNGNPQPPETAAKLVEILARAIHSVHEAGILHRDLKPSNVLLMQTNDKSGVRLNPENGSTNFAQPKITDFGLAKQVGKDSGLTETQTALGTPSYMSPEQAREGKTVTQATDVYSLGTILYEVIVGRPPFQGSNVIETMAHVIHEEPVPPRLFAKSISVDLEAVSLKCLEKEPTHRYPSAAALADDLRRVQEGLPTIARPITGIGRAWRWCRRHQVAVILLVIAALAGLVIQRTVTQRENATRAAGMVNGLLVADTTRVPAIVEDMAFYRKWADPLLNTTFEQSEAGSRERLHAALALMSVDDGKVDYVRDQLHQVTARHVSVLREALRPHQEKVTEHLWPLAQDEHVEPAHRFQAAAALAAFAPDDDRWNDVSPFVAQHLTTVAWPVEFGRWLQHFRPARAVNGFAGHPARGPQPVFAATGSSRSCAG